MLEPFGRQPEMSKAGGVANALNRLLQNLVLKGSKADGIHDYVYVGLIGYGGRVVHGFEGPLANEALVPISQIANHPLRIEERKRLVPNDARGTTSPTIKVPVWFEARPTGRTPMCQALEMARQWLEVFVQGMPTSYPPIAINITDGMATDGDPLPVAQRLQQLATRAGNVLLFNIHISDKTVDPFEFPATEEGLPDRFAKLLFRMSSPLPPKMLDVANQGGHPVGASARGFVFNADLVSVIRFLDMGTMIQPRPPSMA
jgi:hypothetical protein